MIGLFKKPVVIKHTDGFGNVYESDEYIKMRETYMNEYMTRHGETTLHNARVAFGIAMQPAMYTKREALEFLPLADEFNALEEKMTAAGISFKVEDDEEVCAENTEDVDSSSENEVAEKVDQEPASVESESAEPTKEVPAEETATSEKPDAPETAAAVNTHPELIDERYGEIVKAILAIKIPSEHFEEDMLQVMKDYCDNHDNCAINVDEAKTADGELCTKYCLFDESAEDSKKQIALLTLTTTDDEETGTKNVKYATWAFINIDLNVPKCNKQKLILQRLGVSATYVFTDSEDGTRYSRINDIPYTNIFVGTKVQNVGPKSHKIYSGTAEIDILNLACKMEDSKVQELGTVEDLEAEEAAAKTEVDLDIDGNPVTDDVDSDIEIVDDDDQAEKPKKKHTVLKIIAIAVGSIAAVAGAIFGISKLCD